MEEKQIQQEQEHLTEILKEIQTQKLNKQGELELIAKRRKEFSLHFSDDYYYMDDEEALSEGDMLGEFDNMVDNVNKQIARLDRQEYSPYFGRIDFAINGENNYIPYYIGVNNLVNADSEVPLVCDWRAPISSLFYDYELGSVKYISPNGDIFGEINLKRQYEIKKGKLLKAFNSELTIGDDILKDVLSRPSSKKMKTIISSIQKEQNKIIRNSTAKNLLVQGVAGSGKTSIALHRIAFLLYQNRNTLKAENILILSPNTLFSSYISEVLPELGEENMSQMSFYRLAKEELAYLNKKMQTREQNLASIIQNPNRINQVAYKNTYDFFESLQTFSKQYFDMAFLPDDLKFGKDIIRAGELSKLYNKTYLSKKPSVRVEWIIDYIIDKLNITKSIQDVANRLKRIIYPFFVETNILKIYANFLSNIGMQFELENGDTIRYDDLAPLMYLSNYFFGLKSRQEVKYLIIDEMQDYSFVHYSLFNDIFKCDKTVLGDINQCIEKIMHKEDLIKLQEVLGYL